MQERVYIVIPAFNEQASLPMVLRDIPVELVEEIIVVNNNSTDLTEEVAKAAGVRVLNEPRRGYGQACLKGLDYLAQLEHEPDVVVFLDADYSDHPEEMQQLLEAMRENHWDLVIGARVARWRESGSMTVPQVFGNWLATRLMKLLYGARFTDLGPFRAIRYSTLKRIQMQDTNFGWTVEMQIKVLKHSIPYGEVAVHYRNRIGVSKISGTLRGTILAGYKIIGLIFKYALRS